MESATNISARSLQFYVIAKKWASDIEFFKIETAFFYRLIDDYFVNASGSAYSEKVQTIYNLLTNLEVGINNVSFEITEQIKRVELMAEDIVPEYTDALAVKQVDLEYLVTKLTWNFREIKRQIFQLVENSIKNKSVLA